jgi:hypothetical protein
MAIGLETDIPIGLIGVGFPVNEAGVSKNIIKPYYNLPYQMVREGLTKTVAFSLWLNDLGALTSPSPPLAATHTN